MANAKVKWNPGKEKVEEQKYIPKTPKEKTG